MACRPSVWLLCLPAVLLVAAGTLIWRMPAFEGALADAAERRAASSPQSDLKGARFEVAGRDLRIVVETPPPTALVEAWLNAGTPLASLRRIAVSMQPARAMAPFSFRAEREGNAIVLTGALPPGDLRAELHAIARAEAPAVTLSDRAIAGLGAPTDFAASARLAVAAAATLTDGSGTFNGSRLDVAGAAADAATYTRFRRDAAALPGSVFGVLPPRVAAFSWQMSRRRDAIRLDGNVPSEDLRGQAIVAASDLGSPKVVDGMETARGLESGVDFPSLPRRAAGWLERVDEGDVVLAGRSLTVTGRVPSRGRIATLEARIRAELPAGLVLDRVDIAAVPASPYRFEARRRDGGLRLDGFVGSDADRTAMAAAAATRFPLDRIENGLETSDGAPAGHLVAADAALTWLSLLAEGRAEISDRSIRLDGRSLYPESARRLRRDAGRSVPAGWSLDVEIDSPSGERTLDPGLCADLIADANTRQPITFEPGKPDLSVAGREAVAAIARLLRRCGGGAFRVLPQPTPADEAALSRARTILVAALLSEAAGVSVRPDRPDPATASTASANRDRVIVEALQ